jgi:SAM-dependent methyltransferase
LDIGCGGGLFFEKLLEFGNVRGVETDTSLRTGLADVDSRIHWDSLDTYHPDVSFTAILLLDVLEHMKMPSEILKRALDLLEPGGFILATVPAFPVLWTHHDELNHHCTRYTKQSLAEVVSEAGGRIKELHYFFHWTFPAKLAVRLVERVSARRSKTGSIPPIPPAPINRTLYWVSRIEQLCHAESVVPFGSSLLCVAGRVEQLLPEPR